MRTARLRYPCRIGGMLHPAGMIVPVLGETDDAVQNAFPGIATKQGSRQVAVQFPNVEHPTICLISQLEIEVL